ncbi:MAG: hypothetical protein IJQ71_09950 [Clostridia bacterium]|nr:hypothetical protein [Clostridia bacterium]
MMKKLISLILTLVLLAGCCIATAEETVTEKKYESLTVGVTTAFNGNFLADAMGSNISDQDIRKMIHSYHLVTWDGSSGIFRQNGQVITAGVASEDGSTFIYTLANDLTYNDGTPITARDYAFSFLLLTSRQLLESTGLREDGSRIHGWKAYDEGLSATVSGFRLIGDHQIAITISPEFTPYFYEMKAMDFYPLPIKVLAPGCEVRDDGNGIYLSGDFTAQTLQETLLDPDTGYASHPTVTSGPYNLVSYDGKRVELKLNSLYKGDADGSKPYIENIIVRYAPSRDIMANLIVGDVDLAVRCARVEMITTGMALASSDEYALKSYSRNGLSFISFCGEKGPTADVNVRKALAMCLDKDKLVTDYLGNLGTPVKGYYGIGQWMFPMTRGNIPDSWKEEAGEDATWDDINLDGLTEYTLDVDAAKALLDAAGWNLNAEGGAYTEGLRYKAVDGELKPLSLRLIYPNDNLAGPMLEEVFAPYLREAGAEIDFTALSMPTLLQMYYRQIERDCDMILLGSNFQDVFDPSVNYDEYGTDRLTGITDPQLAQLAREMRMTESGDAPQYVRRWIKFLEYRSQVLPEIPLYSNAYMDFSTSALRDYTPGIYSSWSEALMKAYLSDYVEEEEEMVEVGDDEAVFE